MSPTTTTLTTLLLSTLAALSSAAPTSTSAPSTTTTLTTRQSPCASVHIFLAKGWNEPYPGRQGALAGSICWSLDSCDYEDIYFSNTPQDNYCASVTEGAASGAAQINAYAARCPDSKLVLSGYSQGANVIGDIIGGGGGRFGDGAGACEVGWSGGLGNRWEGAGSKVSAVLLFGDTRHVGGKPYNYLDGAQWSSWNPRTPEALVQFDQYADRIRSFCPRSDAVCAASGPGPFRDEDHLNYFDLYTDEAAGWVRWRLTQS